MLPLNLERAGFDRFYAGPLGKELAAKRHLIKATYDFAVLGGAVGTLNLNDQYGNPALIPSGAIVTQVWTDEVTNVTVAGGGTISLGLNTTTDLLGATAGATFAGIQAGVPVGSAATMVKATADRALTLTIATAAVTAGKLDVYVELAFVAP